MQSLLPTTCLLQDLAAAVYPNPMLSVKYPEERIQPTTNTKPYSNNNSSKCAIQFLLNSQMELSPVQPFTDANKNTRSISKQVSRRITKGTVATFDNAFTITHFHVPIKRSKVEKDLLGQKRTRPPSPHAYQFVILPPSSY